MTSTRSSNRPHRPHGRTFAISVLIIAQVSAFCTGSSLSHASARTLVASDEFAGPWGQPPDAHIWSELQGGGGWGNHELQSYTTRQENVRRNGAGALQIVARKESYTGSDGVTSAYTSARLISRQSVLYGYIEARVYLPSGQGLWPAFWTIGADVYEGVPWPVTGEIDVMESKNLMTSLTGALHGPTTTGAAYAQNIQVTPATALAGNWHTYAIDWTAAAVTWYLDGTPYATITKAGLPAADTWEFDKPQLLQLNLAVGGDSPGSPDSTTTWPASMLVDYVRIYSH